jgi:hypothetical protein
MEGNEDEEQECYRKALGIFKGLKETYDHPIPEYILELNDE